ncbi:AI-2E family transporter [Clostridium sp. DJ247]|uniref:AI-2E family transporter n=1 Tax=Clostridium sp. DJ247 TaxID=2726188 RepID=UPI00162ACCE7|nr:AI-2E family transporter [Clostridium sp. DJ247]MBC2579015.1 AI-2E family transporter [Clostridium sp. DJ247]
MKKFKTKYFIKYSIVSIVIFALIILCLRSQIIREVLYLLLLSFAIAYTLKPIQKRLNYSGVSDSTAALILICALVLIILLLFVVVIPSIFKESLNINTTIDKIQNYINGFYSRLKPIRNNKIMYAITDKIYLKIDSYFLGISSKIFDTALKLGQNIITIAVIPIVAYYFLADSNYINNRVLNFFPLRSRNIVRKISCDVDKILGRYIVSQLILCGFIGIVTFVVLLILHIDFPVVLSLLNAFFNIIPYFGPIFGALPAIFIALIKSPEKALYTAIWLYLLQQIEGNVLSPKITGDSVNMHPLVVIILLIIGGEAAGFIGMVLAIPIGVIIKVIYEDLNYYLF